MAKEIEAIERTILAAIVEGRIAPGAKLSENALASAFDVSRTMIREALARLEARKVLSVQARKGWFVNVPDAKEAAEVYSARRAVECGYLMYADPFTDAQIACLRKHIADEREAIGKGDKALLTYLMGDFHVRIIEQSGNSALVEIIRNLTARTILISLCYQSQRNALASHEDHVRIFEALVEGDMRLAAQLCHDHLEDVETGITIDTAPSSIDMLRNSLRLDMAPSEAEPECATSFFEQGTSDDH
ncbi:GntR family transcriptional regulator [Amaricoccus macauensis]|uniref:GntR family transcriptional regulator n=1 Tax=Amaricoccus macauensis TaxID=57001 RepID=UPI003C7B6D47